MFNHTLLHKLVTRFEPQIATKVTRSPRTVELGNDSALVQSLQITLADLNLYHGTIDGHFSPALELALKQVQQHFHLPITGQLDSKTWYALSFWGDDLKAKVMSQSPSPNQAFTPNFTSSFA
ncbi:MAG: peptidoglycan-binding domain-containing protein [Prochlorothrix sp.]|nr:peptidoglycan-binding domain-containing protein [Prochlorothrix sp.]